MNARSVGRVEVPPIWLQIPIWVFLGLTVVFFITSHDMFRNQNAAFRGVEQFNPTEEEALQLLAQYETGQTYKAIAYLALGGLSLLGVFALQKWRPLRLQGLLGRLAVFFFLWVLLSGLWSFEPKITANKLAIFAMLSLAALFVAQRFRIEDLLYFVLFSSTVYLLCGVGSEIAYGSFRPWVAGYRFAGTIHPNGQGINCALLFLASLFAAARFPQYRRLLFLLAVVAFAFLLMTKSRTPFAVALACLGVYAILWLPMSLKFFLGISAAVVACAVPIFYPVLGPMVERVVLLGRTETTLSHATQLTGRTDLWAECWYYIQQSPVIGYGYNSFWTLENTQDIAWQIDWYSGSAHSIYLDLWLGLGIFGLAAYVLLLLGAMFHFGRLAFTTGNAAYGFATVLILFSMIHGIFESTFIFPALHMFLILMLLARAAFVEEEDEQVLAEAQLPAPTPRGAMVPAR